MSMRLFLKEIKQIRKDYLSSDACGSIIIAKELDILIKATETKINDNIKHYNGDEERAVDDFMLEKWINAIEDYYLIFKQIENLDNFTKKQFRILVNKIQSIKL